MTRINDVVSGTQGVFERQFDLLKLEMTLIDNAIRSQDDITKSIKNWAIVTWTAGVGFAVANPVLKPFVWATAFVPLAFWIVDGFFRRVQRTFIVRLQDIAQFVNSPSFAEAAASGAPIAFPLLQMRSKAGRKTSWTAVMHFRTVAALYLLMMAGSVCLSILLATSDK